MYKILLLLSNNPNSFKKSVIKWNYIHTFVQYFFLLNFYVWSWNQLADRATEMDVREY